MRWDAVGMSAPLDPKSPSMRLWRTLIEHGVGADQATELMNGYAHELAERQRYAHDEVGGGCSLGVCHGGSMPDLIDPEQPDPTF